MAPRASHRQSVSLPPDGTPSVAAVAPCSVRDMAERFRKRLHADGGHKNARASTADSDAEKPAKKIKNAAEAEQSILRRPSAAPILRRPSAAETPKCSFAPAALKYPGIPTAPRDPISFKNLQVYTDLKKQAWRVKPIGVRQDASFSWKSDGPSAWKRLRDHVLGYQ